MLHQIEEVRRPGSVDAAWSVLADLGPRARLLGGGTDLATRCPAEVTTLVDLAGAGLGDITVDGDGSVRIGAMATFSDLLETPAVAGHAGGVLAETLVHVGSLLHRNSATIGGHVARGRLSDVVPVLLALDARVGVHDGANHVVALEDYYAHDRHRDRHLVVEVVLPPAPARSGATFERFSRSAYDHALVNVACRVDLDGSATVSDARIVIGQIVDRGSRARDAEQALIGTSAQPDAVADVAARARAGHEVAGDWLVSAAFRRHLVGVLVERGLGRAVARARGGRR